jgi:TPP-dependent pyruvate/acetoin dehydrogenase alpha subunit
VLTKKVEDEMEADAKQEIDEAVQQSSDAPFPEVAEGAYPVYVEDIKHG